MTNDDDIALATYGNDIHSDGWMGADANLVVLTYAPFTALELSFWTPPTAGVRRITACVGEWSGRVETRPGEATVLEVPCNGSPGGVEVRLRILGSEAGPPPDSRVLGAILGGIQGVRGRRGSKPTDEQKARPFSMETAPEATIKSAIPAG